MKKSNFNVSPFSGLAISEEDREIVKREVNIVFHSAATVKFDDLLTKSVSMNVRGTKELMNLAKEMKNLISFVHVSTCYVHCHRQGEVIREEIYPPEKFSVKEVLDMCEHNTGKKLFRLISTIQGYSYNQAHWLG